AWSVAAWAVGVWGSVLGSVLLLLRSRHAATAFLVSLVGALVSFCYQFLTERPGSLEGGMSTVMPAVILHLIVAQWYYARRPAAAGVLRRSGLARFDQPQKDRGHRTVDGVPRVGATPPFARGAVRRAQG